MNKLKEIFLHFNTTLQNNETSLLHNFPKGNLTLFHRLRGYKKEYQRIGKIEKRIIFTENFHE